MNIFDKDIADIQKQNKGHQGFSRKEEQTWKILQTEAKAIAKSSARVRSTEKKGKIES